MNIANAAGVMLLALMALLDAMKRKGVINFKEIDDALEVAEANALSDPVQLSALKDAHIGALLFPIRFLRQATVASKTPKSFTAITERN